MNFMTFSMCNRVIHVCIYMYVAVGHGKGTQMTDVLKYFIFIVVGAFVPFILVGNPPPGALRRRYLLAVAAGILAGLFSGFAVKFPGLISADALVMGMTDSLPGFVLAAVLGTILYLLFNTSIHRKPQPNTR